MKDASGKKTLVDETIDTSKMTDFEAQMSQMTGYQYRPENKFKSPTEFHERP